MQPLRVDPDNPPLEGTNEIAQARTPQARPSGPAGRRTSITIFFAKGDAFPAVVSLLFLLTGDIELNIGPNCYTCRKPFRRGMDYLQCQANSRTNGSHKQLRCIGFHRSQLTNSWRCPPHGGPGPPHRASTTSTICDSCQQLIGAGIRPLTCATPYCARLVHSARRRSGPSAHQGRWLCRQHCQPNHLSETVAGRPTTQIQLRYNR